MRPFGIVPGSRRNLSVPTHVAWMGGVMGATVDPSVQWSTDADGTMRSSAGETIVDYRPWESREQNLKRGVYKPRTRRCASVSSMGGSVSSTGSESGTQH